MIYYLDTSALAKAYLQEAGSVIVRALWGRNDVLATSQIAYAEVLSAFNRRLREKSFTQEGYADLVSSFETDWKLLVHVDLAPGLEPIVRRVLERHALRGFDAIHLASAIRSQRKELPVTFVCADKLLTEAARKESFQVLVPE